MQTIIKLSIIVVYLAPSIAYSMRLPCRTSVQRPCPQRQTVPNFALAKRCTQMAPRRSTTSMPIRAYQLQEINSQLHKAYTKKIAAKCKSIAWDASGVAVVLPTVATYYFSGAGICVALLSAPSLSPADCFDAQIPLLIMGTLHLASRFALSAEEKLCDFIGKKCDENDKEVIEVNNLIEKLRTQRKCL